MKETEFVAKRALKITLSLILIPIARFVVMPALMPAVPDGVSQQMNQLAGLFRGTPEIPNGVISQPSSDAAQKMQEAAKRINSDYINTSVRMGSSDEATASTTATSKKPANPPPSKPARRSHRLRMEAFC